MANATRRGPGVNGRTADNDHKHGGKGAPRRAPRTLDEGLPVNLDAERFVLGSVLLNDALLLPAMAKLGPDDFALEAHRRIFRRMTDLQERSERVDRVTVANELMRYGELEQCGGLSYLVTLDDGLPQILNLDSYVRIVQDKSLLRRIVFAAQNVTARCLLQEDAPDEILAGAGETLLKLGQTRAESGLASLRQIVEDFPGGLQALCGEGIKSRGLATGFARYDSLTGGLQPGELTIIGARPSMGKTALCLNIAHHIAHREKTGVAIFSLEMAREALLTRLLCQTARVNSYAFREGLLNPDDRRRIYGASYIYDLPIYIDDSASMTAFDMHSEVLRMRARQPVGAVIVDYLQLVDSHVSAENRDKEIGLITKSLKQVAKALKVPVVVLCQLSRECEKRSDKRPLLGDLRDSGNIEQDADVVAFLFREEVYNPGHSDLHGQAELILRKQRNGPIGTIPLVWLAQFTKFENRAEDIREAA